MATINQWANGSKRSVFFEKWVKLEPDLRRFPAIHRLLHTQGLFRNLHGQRQKVPCICLGWLNHKLIIQQKHTIMDFWGSKHGEPSPKIGGYKRLILCLFRDSSAPCLVAFCAAWSPCCFLTPDDPQLERGYIISDEQDAIINLDNHEWWPSLTVIIGSPNWEAKRHG